MGNKAFIRFPGLEHELGLSHRAEKALSVKVEVDTRPPAGAGLEVTTVRRHATLRLAHYDKPSLLADKVAALLLPGLDQGPRRVRSGVVSERPNLARAQ